MRGIALAGLLPVLWAVPPFSGMARAESPLIVTEAEFLSALDDSHPAVAERAEALAVARAGVFAASTLENPVLSVMREDPSGPVEETEWSVSWRFPERGRKPRIASRRAAVEAETARHVQDATLARAAMREAYAEWAIASERVDRLSAHRDRIATLAARERLRAARGEVSGLEVGRLDLAAEGLELRIEMAAAAADRARFRAAAWSPIVGPRSRPELPELPSLGETDHAHPLLEAANRDLDAAMLERQATRISLVPEVSVGWKREREAGPASIDGPVFGLSWSVPVLNRKRAERARSDAGIAAARARLERTEREIESSREGASATFARLSAALERALATRQRNEELVRSAEAKFRFGESSLTDLLETLRAVTDAELALLDLHRAALEAHREWERVAGTATAPMATDLGPHLKENVP